MTVLDQVGTAKKSGLFRGLTPLRVAIVGCGPKALFCIKLLAKQSESQSIHRPLLISFFEPAEFPGAGLVYDPRQPRYLRMNFAAEHINTWDSETEGPCLLQWLRSHHPNLATADQFVPRGIVGEYLHACFLSVVNRLSKYATVSHVKEQVVEVIKANSKWDVVTSSGRIAHDFNEVLLAVGHEGWRAAEPDAGQMERFDIAHVYPTDRQLSFESVLPESRVALRGLGLTAIDAILALSEGRGGSFTQTSEGWRYEASGSEPAKIYPYSRSGRPMLAKPIAQMMSVPDIENLWSFYAARLVSLADDKHPLSFGEEIWPEVIAAAEAALQAVGGTGVAPWFESRFRDHANADKFREEIAASIQVATGKQRPDAAWALGEAWRRLYPTLVNVISHDGLSVASWQQFRKVAGEMERIAFGPPVVNCNKILSLVDCGIVDLAYLQGKVKLSASSQRILQCDFNERFERIDHHVNAVLPNSANSNPCGPLSSLAKSGMLRLHVSGYGYEIDRSGRPVTVEGNSLHGVTLVGRPTEGCILGNDTLNPRLHDQAGAWAQRVVQELKRWERSSL